MRGLSLVVASRGHSSSRCTGLSLSRPLLLRSTGSRHAGSVVVAHGPSCSVACGIFPDQGLNLCSLHWQADSQPLRHQGSPFNCVLPGVFLMVRLRLWVLGWKITDKLPFSTHHIKDICYRQNWSLMMLTLITWRKYFLDFSTRQLRPLFIAYTLEASH